MMTTDHSFKFTLYRGTHVIYYTERVRVIELDQY